MNAGIGVDQDTLRGEPLGTVAGDGIAMIKMAMFFWVEFNLTIVFESASDAAIGFNLFDYRKIPISNAKRLVRRGELDAVAFGEFPADFTVDADTGEAARIICGPFAMTIARP